MPGISVELSVAPHYHADPPHVLRSWEFKDWAAVAKWQRLMQFKTDSSCFDTMIEDAPSDYVQVELELLDQTGQVYTEAVLAVEGQEEE